MPGTNPKPKIPPANGPYFDQELLANDPEKLMEMFGLMAGAPKTSLAVDQRKDPVATPSAGMLGGGMVASAPLKPVPVQTGPGMNINPADYDWKLLNPPDYAKMRTDSGSGGMAPYQPMGSQSGGVSAGGVPDIDSMLKSMFDVGVGSGGTGGLWASPEQRAFAAKQQLEMMKLASGERSDQAKLEAARTDAQSQRDFQSGEKSLDRTAQEAIANLQYGPAQHKKNIFGVLLAENMKKFGGDFKAANAATEKQMAESEALNPAHRSRESTTTPGTPTTAARPGSDSVPPPALGPVDRINELLPEIGVFGGDRPFDQNEAHRVLDVMSRSSLGDGDLSEIARRIKSGNLAGDPEAAMKSLAQAYARALAYTTGRNDVDLNLPDNASLYYQPGSVLSGIVRGPGLSVGAPNLNKIRIPTGQVFPTGDMPYAGPIENSTQAQRDQFRKQAEMAAYLFRQMAEAQKQGR